MNILKASVKPKLHIKLVKLEQTENAWIFTFGDVIWRFKQKFILPKRADWEAAEYMWERVHEVFVEKAREAQWTQR